MYKTAACDILTLKITKLNNFILTIYLQRFCPSSKAQNITTNIDLTRTVHVL